jgi:hypothetical protein
MLTTVPIRGICNITLSLGRSLTLQSLFHLQPMDDLQGAAVFFFWVWCGWFWAEMGRKHEKFLGLPSIFGKIGWEIALLPLGFPAAARVLAEHKEQKEEEERMCACGCEGGKPRAGRRDESSERWRRRREDRFWCD